MDRDQRPARQHRRAFDAATTAKFVLLTTYRKDGTPVSSPLWGVTEGNEMFMWTPADSWKIKRLRRDQKVVVQACDRMGKTLEGNPVEGRAELLDEAGTDRAKKLLVGKYGLLARLVIVGSKLRRGSAGTIGFAIRPVA